jgi:hypothetical protein
MDDFALGWIGIANGGTSNGNPLVNILGEDRIITIVSQNVSLTFQADPTVSTILSTERFSCELVITKF